MTNQTPEELRKQAEELIAKAQEAEREARNQKAKAERELRRQRHSEAVKSIANPLIEALGIAKISAKFVPASEGGWGDKVVVESDPNFTISLSAGFRNFDPFALSSVSIQVGTYGEHPQTWTAAIANGLKFDAIVKSIERRLKDRILKHERWARDRQIQEKRYSTRKTNENICERLRVLRPKDSGIMLEPTETEDGKIIFQLRRELTEQQAISLINVLKNHQ